MIRVRNRHAAAVGGVAPGAVGNVTAETLRRYPWALSALSPVEDMEHSSDASQSPSEPLPARAQIRAIRDSDSIEYVERWIGDGRSSVHGAAVKRLRRLRKEAQDG